MYDFYYFSCVCDFDEHIKAKITFYDHIPFKDFDFVLLFDKFVQCMDNEIKLYVTFFDKNSKKLEKPKIIDEFESKEYNGDYLYDFRELFVAYFSEYEDEKSDLDRIEPHHVSLKDLNKRDLVMALFDQYQYFDSFDLEIEYGEYKLISDNLFLVKNEYNFTWERSEPEFLYVMQLLYDSEKEPPKEFIDILKSLDSKIFYVAFLDNQPYSEDQGMDEWDEFIEDVKKNYDKEECFYYYFYIIWPPENIKELLEL